MVIKWTTTEWGSSWRLTVSQTNKTTTHIKQNHRNLESVQQETGWHQQDSHLQCDIILAVKTWNVCDTSSFSPSTQLTVLSQNASWRPETSMSSQFLQPWKRIPSSRAQSVQWASLFGPPRLLLRRAHVFCSPFITAQASQQIKSSQRRCLFGDYMLLFLPGCQCPQTGTSTSRNTCSLSRVPDALTRTRGHPSCSHVLHRVEPFWTESQSFVNHTDINKDGSPVFVWCWWCHHFYSIK